jgi:hypothetical protein
MEQIETPKQYSMSFTQDELNMIIAALSELPFKVSQPLISKMIKDFADITASEPATQPVVE